MGCFRNDMVLHGVLLLMSGAIAFFALVLATPSGPLSYIALLEVTPSSNVDRPRVWMGVFSSCWQINSSVTPRCTKPTIPPRYNFSVLSAVNNTASLDAAAPSFAIVLILCISFALSVPYWALWCLWCLTLHTPYDFFDTYRIMLKKCAPVAILGCCCSFVTYFLIYMSYTGIISIFNDSQGQYTNLDAHPGSWSLFFVIFGHLTFLATLLCLERILIANKYKEQVK